MVRIKRHLLSSKSNHLLKRIDILIVTYPKWSQRISDYINKVYEWSEESKTVVQTIEVPEGTGTADALRALKNKIKASSFFFLFPLNRILTLI